MSLSKNPKLLLIAKLRCRELRKHQTKAEDKLWDEIRNRKILGLKFYRQHPLFHNLMGKETFYIADFYCHEKRLVVEIDGAIHKYQKKKDNERTEIINLLGIEVVRISNEDVENNIAVVLRKLEKILRAK